MDGMGMDEWRCKAEKQKIGRRDEVREKYYCSLCPHFAIGKRKKFPGVA